MSCEVWQSLTQTVFFCHVQFGSLRQTVFLCHVKFGRVLDRQYFSVMCSLAVLDKQYFSIMCSFVEYYTNKIFLSCVSNNVLCGSFSDGQ